MVPVNQAPLLPQAAERGSSKKRETLTETVKSLKDRSFQKGTLIQPAVAQPRKMKQNVSRNSQIKFQSNSISTHGSRRDNKTKGKSFGGCDKQFLSSFPSK
jgi:hypothetical protein